MDELPELIVANAAAWHSWLPSHHADETGVWLVLAKKGTTEPTSLTYVQALDEALCHGWIDGQIGRRDERTELFKDLGVPAGFPNDFNDHIVSGLKIGMDGYLYISVGDKGVPKATGPDGRTAQVVGGGTLRCRPDGTGPRHRLRNAGLL